MNKFEAMQAFCAVAEQGSFAGAAKELNVSSTMVSRYVKQLEHHLGCLLLKRNTRKVFLTDAGQEYRNHIKPIIKKLRLVESQMSDYSDTPSGKLAISASIEFGSQYLVPMIKAFNLQYPELVLDVELCNEPLDLFNSHIDLVFRVAPTLPNASHIAQTVCSSRLSLWASPEYVKTHGKLNDLMDLRQHNLLFFNHTIRRDHWLFDVEGKLEALKLDWTLTSNNGRFLNEAAAQNMGIIQAPSYSVSSYVKAGKLVEVMPQYQIKPLNISVIYPHRLELSSRVKAFVNFAKDYFFKHPID